MKLISTLRMLPLTSWFPVRLPVGCIELHSTSHVRRCTSQLWVGKQKERFVLFPTPPQRTRRCRGSRKATDADRVINLRRAANRVASALPEWPASLSRLLACNPDRTRRWRSKESGPKPWRWSRTDSLWLNTASLITEAGRQGAFNMILFVIHFRITRGASGAAGKQPWRGRCP